MRDRHTKVRVLVARRVLQDMKDSPSDSGAYMARIESFRRQFEAIASDKFDYRHRKGKFEITSGDIGRLLVERLNSKRDETRSGRKSDRLLKNVPFSRRDFFLRACGERR
jgi:hypothetical protein